MDFEEYRDLYESYLMERFGDNSDKYNDEMDDAFLYDTDEWNYRGDFRKYLTDHPAIEFYECETAGAQGICQEAGTFCDHTMTAHNNAY